MNHPRTTAAIVLLAVVPAVSRAQSVHAPMYPFIGDAARDFFGGAVAGAGDVNNDGYDDVIVGAIQANGGPGLARVFDGRTGRVLYTLSGNSPDDDFGRSVAGAGDVNNDGFDDVIVGADQDAPGGEFSGSASVFSGQTGLLLFSVSGTGPFQLLGSSVSGAGDVNNDGFDDVLVGAPGDAGNLGTARLVSGADGSVLHVFTGDLANAGFGTSVSAAGDVNNDGQPDVVVGGFGRVRVFSGSTGAAIHTFSGSSSDGFGIAVAGAGDVNNDGFDDILVGAPYAASGAGRAIVYSGATGAVLRTLNGTPGSVFGYAVSGAGDVNADNFDDLFIGALLGGSNPPNTGAATIFSGATGAVLKSFSGEANGDAFGAAVARAGDVNNDGVPDLIVGASRTTYKGEFSGSASVLRSVLAPAAPPSAPCPGDADGSRSVNFLDITTVLANFGTACP